MAWFKQLKERRKYKKWIADGRPVPPPPLAKQEMHLDYAKRFDLKLFVETGTFKGDTVEMMRPYFERIYSIELADKFYGEAKKRFAGVSKIELFHGDSGKLMPEVVAKLDAPTLFWLDGHYSGGDTAQGELKAPVWPELRAIFAGMKERFVVLIDDARCFRNVGGEDYPAVSDIEAWVAQERPDLGLEVEMDCIRIAPKLS
ncbi:glycosyltransferase group 1 family [Haloferula helveola]|uniref:Glycosyltransferase group 1 family n=1 Tax=Haloferula helveola TaxID=490095 RepID=A0ABM7RJ09_9BACT|nr:glycosyltransferase group 1 family [Haloferula helveola]